MLRALSHKSPPTSLPIWWPAPFPHYHVQPRYLHFTWEETDGETENALNQEVLRTCSGLMGPRTPSLDVQDKSEGPGLGLKSSQGDRAQPHLRAVGGREGPWSGVSQCGPVSELLFLLVFTLRPVRSQMPVP